MARRLLDDQQRVKANENKHLKDLWAAIFYADYYEQVTQGVNQMMHSNKKTHDIYPPTVEHKKKLVKPLDDVKRKKHIKDPILLKNHNQKQRINKVDIKKQFFSLWNEISFEIDQKNGLNRQLPPRRHFESRKRQEFRKNRRKNRKDKSVLFFDIPGIGIEPPKILDEDQQSSYFSSQQNLSVHEHFSAIDRNIIERLAPADMIQNPHVGYISKIEIDFSEEDELKQRQDEFERILEERRRVNEYPSNKFHVVSQLQAPQQAERMQNITPISQRQSKTRNNINLNEELQIPESTSLQNIRFLNTLSKENTNSQDIDRIVPPEQYKVQDEVAIEKKSESVSNQFEQQQKLSSIKKTSAIQKVSGEQIEELQKGSAEKIQIIQSQKTKQNPLYGQSPKSPKRSLSPPTESSVEYSKDNVQPLPQKIRKEKKLKTSVSRKTIRVNLPEKPIRKAHSRIENEDNSENLSKTKKRMQDLKILGSPNLPPIHEKGQKNFTNISNMQNFILITHRQSTNIFGKKNQSRVKRHNQNGQHVQLITINYLEQIIFRQFLELIFFYFFFPFLKTSEQSSGNNSNRENQKNAYKYPNCSTYSTIIEIVLYNVLYLLN